MLGHFLAFKNVFVPFSNISYDYLYLYIRILKKNILVYNNLWNLCVEVGRENTMVISRKTGIRCRYYFECTNTLEFRWYRDELNPFLSSKCH